MYKYQWATCYPYLFAWTGGPYHYPVGKACRDLSRARAPRSGGCAVSFLPRCRGQTKDVKAKYFFFGETDASCQSCCVQLGCYFGHWYFRHRLGQPCLCPNRQIRSLSTWAAILVVNAVRLWHGQSRTSCQVAKEPDLAICLRPGL